MPPAFTVIWSHFHRPISLLLDCWSSGVTSLNTFLTSLYRCAPQIKNTPPSTTEIHPIASNAGWSRYLIRPIPAAQNAREVRKNASSVLSLAMMVRPMVRRLAGSRLALSGMSFTFYQLPHFNKLSIFRRRFHAHAFMTLCLCSYLTRVQIFEYQRS